MKLHRWVTQLLASYIAGLHNYWQVILLGYTSEVTLLGYTTTGKWSYITGLLASYIAGLLTQLYSLVELFMYNYNKLVGRSVTIHVQNGKLFLIQ